jgi:hypothetical protein
MDRVEIARCRRSWRLALPVIGRQEWKQGSEGRNRPTDSAILAAEGVGERRETKGWKTNRPSSYATIRVVRVVGSSDWV